MVYKKYNSIDVVKFLLALLIVMSHYASEWGHFSSNIDMLFSLYIVAVPFFFVCSSFFVFRKFNTVHNDAERKVIVVKYIKRIIVMYASWSCVYIIFNILTWCVYGVTSQEIMAYIHELLVYSSYNTIWFLPATAVGVAMVYLLSRRFKSHQIIAIALIIYILGCVGQSYSFVLDNYRVLKNIYNVYNALFLTTRNGIFNGFPFAALGYVIAFESKPEKKGFINKNMFFSVLFLIGFVFEAIVLKKFFSAINVNTILFLFPFSYYFYKWLLGIELKSKNYFITLRKLSTVIFLSQRIFLTALPRLFPQSIFVYLLTCNSYVGLIYILLITILFSYLIIKFDNFRIVKAFI